VAEQPLWFVGNRTPSYTKTLAVNGVPVDLTGATVTFSMRPVGTSTLKVTAQPVTVVGSPLAGNVRYDWAAADVDTAGQYLAWFTVTNAGKTQDVGETVLEFRAHANANVYLELEQLKSSLELSGQTFADQDMRLAAGAASRAVDRLTGRRFWLDSGTSNVRYYTPEQIRFLQIDDLATLTSVAIDRGGSGTYTETWVNGTDFVLEPLNATSEIPARPYEWLRVRQLSGRWLPTYIEKSVQVTGQFGWLTVPDDVRAAASILAAKLLRRVREAPFGIVTVGIDEGAAMRIARTDPDVFTLLNDYSRRQPLA
jgi:hypothetical protein